MRERSQWLRRRVTTGGLLIGIGLLLFAGSLIAQAANPNVAFDFRIVGGLGIGLAGGGAALVVKYGAGLRDEPTGRRIVAEEMDERAVSIRQRAASRAYWVSAVLVFGGLMWTSFAANGKLQALEGDALWNFLAVATVLPALVYVGSLLLDEHNA